MTRFGLIAISVAGLVVALCLGLFFGYIGFSNEANKFEADIPAQYSEMQNVYDNGWKQVMEENQLSNKYADQFKNAFQAILRGDQGGQQAMIQVLTAMPNFDSSVTKKVQESVERFHAQFQASQTNIIARKQAYQTFLFATTSGRLYNSFAGYPRIRCGVPAGNADNYQIVTSDKTQTDFANHKSGTLDLK